MPSIEPGTSYHALVSEGHFFLQPGLRQLRVGQVSAVAVSGRLAGCSEVDRRGRGTRAARRSYLPLGALLVKQHIAQVLRDSGDPFFSGQTYSCIPLAAAVGIAVLDCIEGDGLVQNSQAVGTELLSTMQQLLELPNVGNVRGAGLFLGVEFVADPETKQPLEPSLGFSKRVEAACLQQGLVVLGSRGTVENTKGDHLLLAPPLTLNAAQADELYQALRAGITAANATL